MIDDVFAVIADPTRRQILRALSSGERPVGDLVDELGVSQPTVSKHLKVLRTIGLVETQAVGQKRVYSLTPAPLAKVSLWIDALNSAYDRTTTSPESAITTPDPLTPDSFLPASANTDSGEQQAERHAEEEQSTTMNTSFDTFPETENEDVAQTGSIDMGSEGASYVLGQPRHSSAAISFSPLKPFTPLPLDEIFGQSKVNKETPKPVAQTPEEEFKMSELPIAEFPASRNATAETKEVEEANEEMETLTPNPEEPLETPFSEEPTPPSSQIQELPVLPSAAESVENHSVDENRGLLATLTRWGRRRSR